MKAITTPGIARPNADRPEISRQDVLEQQQGERKAIVGSVFDDMMEVFQFLELVMVLGVPADPIVRRGSREMPRRMKYWHIAWAER